jgi:hypothetical protein
MTREAREEIFAAAVLRQVERGRLWLMTTTQMVEETTRQARAKRKEVERAIRAQGGVRRRSGDQAAGRRASQ